MIPREEVPNASCLVTVGGNPYTDSVNRETGKLGLENVSGKCTGVLIAPQWVLTAGHCRDATGVKCLGSGSPAEISRVDQVVAFPLYFKEDSIAAHRWWARDLALVHLKDSLSVPPMRLVENDDERATLLKSDQCFAAGYAPPQDIITVDLPDNNTDSIAAHRAGKVKFLDFDRVQRMLPELAGFSNDLFTSFPGAMINHGDSGGPLYCLKNGKPVLLGIHSQRRRDSVEYKKIQTNYQFGISVSLGALEREWITQTLHPSASTQPLNLTPLLTDAKKDLIKYAKFTLGMDAPPFPPHPDVVMDESEITRKAIITGLTTELTAIEGKTAVPSLKDCEQIARIIREASEVNGKETGN